MKDCVWIRWKTCRTS